MIGEGFAMFRWTVYHWPECSREPSAYLRAGFLAEWRYWKEYHK
jgi:hypothetical protein